MSETQLEPSDLIRIPGGKFPMGQENGRDDERPVHRVTVAPFLLCRFSDDQRALGGVPQGHRAREGGVHARNRAGRFGELVRRLGILPLALGGVGQTRAIAQ